jgi:WD40 repeat protein/Tfp pilus assembly protein PilF
MSRHFTCPKGHEWELPETTSSLTAHMDPNCPVCGAAAQLSAEDRGGVGASKSIKMALGPAPVEGGAGQARVPAPLPVRQASVPSPTQTPVPSPSPRPAASTSAGTAVLPDAPSPIRPPYGPTGPARRDDDDEDGRSRGWSWTHPITISLLSAIAVLIGAVVLVAVINARSLAQAKRDAEDKYQKLERKELQARKLRDDEVKARIKAQEIARDMERARIEAETERDAAKTDARNADKTAKKVLDERGGDAAAAENAETLRKAEEQERRKAVEKRQEAERRLARVYFANGNRLIERGEYIEALPWFTEALGLEGDAKREPAHRLRLAAILSQCPRLLQAWFLDAAATAGQLSPDGKRVLTASAKTVQVWDAATGKAVGEEIKLDALVTSAAFSADGRRVLTTSKDNAARLWDAATGKPVTPAIDHPGAVARAALAPNGLRILTVSVNPQNGAFIARMWDASTGAAAGQPWVLGRAVNQVSFSPDSRLILTAGVDGTARLWSAGGGGQAAPSMEHAAPVNQAVFSPDGKQVVTASADASARAWETATGKAITPPIKHNDAVTLASFRSDGRQVLTAGADKVVRAWDATTGQPIGLGMKHTGPLSAATFSPDGRHVLTSCTDGSVHLWDAVTGDEAMPPLLQRGSVKSASFSPDGVRVLTLGEQEVRLWDVTGGEPPIRPANVRNQRAGSILFSPDGKHMARLSGNEAQLYATETGKTVGQALKHDYAVGLAAFSPDSSRLFTLSQKTSGDPDAKIFVWDTATGAAVGTTIEVLSPVRRALFSPEGGRIVTYTANDNITVWDVGTGKQIGKAIDLGAVAHHIIFSPDGKTLATANQYGLMQTWDAATGEEAGPQMKQDQAVTWFSYTADGKFLLTGSLDGTVRLRDVSNGDTKVGPIKHGGRILFASRSADGTRIVSTSADGTARVWWKKDDDGEPVTLILKHDAPVPMAALSPDGKWLATASGNSIRLWDAATGDPVTPSMKHCYERRPITEVFFTRDGKLMTAHGIANDPAARQVWHLVPDDRTVQELQQLSLLLSGHQVSSEGGLAASDVKDESAAWQALQPKYAADFAAVDARLSAWHQRAVDECERRDLWTGALTHLAALLEKDTSRWDYRARRARAYAKLKQWAAAAADFEQAARAKPDRVELWDGLANAATELRNWDKAITALTGAIKLQGDDRDLWARRGRCHAELKQYDKAATDLAKAVSLGREDASNWHRQLLLRLAAGKLDAYRKDCVRMDRHFKNSENPQKVVIVAWTCALAPTALTDLKPLLERAEKAAKDNPTSSAYVGTLGALLYRAGRYDDAVKRLEEAVKLHGKGGTPVAALFLAMAHHQLGHAGDAQKYLSQAVEAINQAPKDLPWDQRLERDLLRREADALLKK